MNETLKYFFDAYLHQDWRDDYSSSLDAARAFNADEPLDSKKELKAAMLELLENNDLPQDTVNKLGGNFRPETEGMSVNNWIEEVAKIIQA